MERKTRVGKERSKTLLRKLNHLETKFKRTGYYPEWNNRIKDLFKETEVYSFEELIRKNFISVESLILNFEDRN